VPVLDKGVLVGIVTEGDLLHRAEIGTDTRPISWWSRMFKNKAQLAAAYSREHSTHVVDVMTKNVVTVGETTPIADIADLLARRKIRRLPVMRGGKVVGIVSRANIVRALAATANLPRRACKAEDELSVGGFSWLCATRRGQAPARRILRSRTAWFPSGAP
jgi:CBS domain-containing protein